MFTNNYINFMRSKVFDKDVPMTITSGGSVNMRSYNTKEANSIGYSLGYWMNQVCVQAAPGASSVSGIANVACGLYLGTGTTPATKDDYTIEAPITTGLSAVTGSKFEVQEEDGKYTLYTDIVLTNTSESDVAISEFCLFIPFANTSSTPKWYAALAERTVLDEPIVIQPGEQKVVTYKLTFNQTQ